VKPGIRAGAFGRHFAIRPSIHPCFIQATMKLQPTPLAMALAAALGSLAALPASAALTTTTASVAFSNSASVTDPEGGAATTNDGASLGSSLIQQFDANLGVLLGTTLNLSSTRTQTITVAATGDSKAKSSATTTGSGSSTAALSAPGVVDGALGSISANGSCSGTKQAGCSSTTSPAATPTDLSAAVAAASLDSYVGASTVLVTRSSPQLSATQGAGQFPGAESTKYSVTWAGSLSAEYEYLMHAAASFDGASQLSLDLDFGSVVQGSSVAPLDFSLFNAAGERVGLDLDGITPTGDSGVLSTDLALFGALGAGASQGFQAYFDTSTLGSYSASYALSLSDANVGAAASRFSGFSLTLNLSGTVIAQQQPPTNGVPEPAMLGLVGVGLLGLGIGRRRRSPG
jgi:hypothetical protein